MTARDRSDAPNLILQKWAKFHFPSKVIPTVALNTPMSPDFDQDPCPKGLGTKQVTWDWQCWQRRYQMQAAAREAAFECPFLLSGMIGRRFPIPCVFLETASSPKRPPLVPSAYPIPLTGSVRTAHRGLDWI